MRRSVLGWGGVVVGSVAWLHATQAPVPSAPPRALVNQYCVGCHNDRRKTGGLSLDDAALDNVPAHAETWEKVIRKLRSGAMPPDGSPRPSPAARTAVVTSLETAIDTAYAKGPNPGRTETFHRLNRAEYHNAIRDLLDLDVDVAALLPADDVSYGFDNMAGVLGMSPVLLERYTTAAQKISRIAVGSPATPPTADTFRAPSDLPQDQHVEGLPFGTRGGLLIPYTFPLDAQYSVRAKIARDYTDSLAPFYEEHQLEVSIDGERVQIFTVVPVVGRGTPPPTGTSPASATQAPAIGRGAPAGRGATGRGRGDVDAGFEVRVPVKAGPHQVGIAFLKKTSALTESQRIAPLRPAIGAGGDTRYQPYLGSVTISGPFDATGSGDTPSRRRIFTCDSEQGGGLRAESKQGSGLSGGDNQGLGLRPEGCAKQILTTLARRAYRRSVTDADLQPLLAFYRNGVADASAPSGAKMSPQSAFDGGIELALRRLLVSPAFLLRIERDPANVAPNTTYRISDIELASRLSFFLWSSIPDDQLLDVAARGRLKDPTVLAQQVRRMLADPRSHALVSNFAGQWLYLRNLPAFRPDEELFPDFDDGLRQAFRQETELFFDAILHENRPVLELLNANYTFLNERLARHYGIPDVYGSQFRRVALMGSVRGGLLGQGSILAVTSYPTRTSPVLRGKWVLDNLLGMPPPEPPANVPALKENAENSAALSVRERLEQHRSNPGCASCHKIMDPLGFALENFDAVGRWRDRGEDGAPLNTAGALLDGTKLEGPASLKQALLGHPDDFVRTVTEKLLIYALGRGVEYYDEPGIRAIVRDGGGAKSSLSGLIMGIVKSAPFQMRRSSSS